jgi:hypothetical protein
VTEPVLIGLVVVAALGCPLHTWWSHGRGRQAACCPPRGADTEATETLDALRARRRDVEARLAEFEMDAPAPAQVEHPRSRA